MFPGYFAKKQTAPFPQIANVSMHTDTPVSFLTILIGIAGEEQVVRSAGLGLNIQIS